MATMRNIVDMIHSQMGQQAGAGGTIPGPVNPMTGDDTMTPMKQGEYVFPVDAIMALGANMLKGAPTSPEQALMAGKEALDQTVTALKQQAGNPEPPRNAGVAPVLTPQVGMAPGVGFRGLTRHNSGVNSGPVANVGYAQGGSVSPTNYHAPTMAMRAASMRPMSDYQAPGFAQGGMNWPPAPADPAVDDPNKYNIPPPLSVQAANNANTQAAFRASQEGAYTPEPAPTGRYPEGGLLDRAANSAAAATQAAFTPDPEQVSIYSDTSATPQRAMLPAHTPGGVLAPTDPSNTQAAFRASQEGAYQAPTPAAPASPPLTYGGNVGYVGLSGDKNTTLTNIGAPGTSSGTFTGNVPGQDQNSTALIDNLISGQARTTENGYGTALPSMRPAAAPMAPQAPAPLSLYDRLFVGDANIANPSFRNMVAQQGQYNDKLGQFNAAQAHGIAQQGADSNTTVAGSHMLLAQNQGLRVPAQNASDFAEANFRNGSVGIAKDKLGIERALADSTVDLNAEHGYSLRTAADAQTTKADAHASASLARQGAVDEAEMKTLSAADPTFAAKLSTVGGSMARYRTLGPIAAANGLVYKDKPWKDGSIPGFRDDMQPGWYDRQNRLINVDALVTDRMPGDK